MNEIIPIEESRKKIDEIDKEIVRLFKERMESTAKIAEYKRANGLPVHDPARERQVLAKISDLSGKEFSDYCNVLYSTILSLSKSYQRALPGIESDIYDKITTAPDEAPKTFPETVKVSCLGAEGAGSGIAAERLFTLSDITALHCENFRTGLIGRNLSHSFSPEIHSYLADYEYKLYEMEENEVGDFVKNCPLDALNVTIPYKQTVMPYLDFISDTAKRIGSVNTIVKKDGRLYGYNTDYFGFSYMVQKSGIEIENKKVLVLGSGGASLTVKTVLSDMKAREIIIISRNGKNNYENLGIHNDADVIVNTTPVGMYPENGKAPVNLNIFKNLSGVLDLIYNPSVTKLLYDAKKLGIPCLNGLSMLAAQAKKATEIFLSTKICDNKIDLIVKNIENRTKNIVLIGMPGAGKSTAGKVLGEILSREFIDTDSIIEKISGMSIPDIFSLYGEDEFRKRETEAAIQAGKVSGAIIATGGGIVTRDENYYPLSQNSYIVWLKRDTSLLPVDGRPVSQKNDVNELYKKREPLYEKFSATSVEVSADVNNTVERIIEAIRRIEK